MKLKKVLIFALVVLGTLLGALLDGILESDPVAVMKLFHIHK